MIHRRILSLLIALVLVAALLPELPARAEMPYSIGVDLTNQIVTVYDAQTGDIVRQLLCSSGKKKTPTVTGTFTLPKKLKKEERSEWYHFYEGSYAHYATRVWGGYMFHSYLYNRPDESRVQTNTIAYLGVPVSHGCMRMLPSDAQWIAENCLEGTKVKIYYSGERDEYLRAILKVNSFSIDGGTPYNEFVGGATSDGELGYSSTGELVRALQNRLLGLGLYSGSATGHYGPEMVETITTLQTALGLEANGKVNKGLWDLLFSDDAPTSDLISEVGVGSRGPLVKYVQAMLKKASLYDGEINGLFDAYTDAAVRKYQNYAGQEVDGILTSEEQDELRALIEDLNVRYPKGYTLRSWSEEQTMGVIETRADIRLNVRSEPSTSSKSLGQLVSQTEVRILGTEGEWSQVEYKGKTGYVLNEYISTYPAALYHYDFVEDDNPEQVAFDVSEYEFTPLFATEDVTVVQGSKSDNMIFYKDKSVKSGVAFGLLAKSTILLEESDGTWGRATYCGITGYIPLDELQFATQRALSTHGPDEDVQLKARNVSGADVTVYDNVSANSNALGVLADGAEAEVLKRGDTWSQIAFNGGLGYIQNANVQISGVSDRMKDYVASVSGYLSREGAIEGAKVTQGDLALASAIANDAVVPQTDVVEDLGDGLEDFVPSDDDDTIWGDPAQAYAVSAQDVLDRVGKGQKEDVDTSAARAAFDAADAEDPLGREPEEEPVSSTLEGFGP